MTDVSKQLVVAAVQRHIDALVGLSHSLHAEPELAFHEHRSAAKIIELAQQHGFEVERGVGGVETAFTARYGSGEFVVGICAEYDALPEIGHACGHNIIAASSLGAALALCEVADRLGITVKLIGTPAEESGGGKVILLEQGVFDDVAMSLLAHPAPEDTCACRSLAILDLSVCYHGREAHSAAAPHLGRSAADAVTLAQVAIGLLRGQLESEQLVHGIVIDAGAAPNVIPGRASARFDLRASSLESLRRLESRVLACFEGAALSTGCSYDATPISSVYTELVPDPWLAEAYRAAITELGRSPVRGEVERSRTIGSTDMGNVTRVLPGIHPTIAIDCAAATNHQPEFAAACVSPSAARAVYDASVALAFTAVAAARDDRQRDHLIGEVTQRRAAAVAGGAP